MLPKPIFSPVFDVALAEVNGHSVATLINSLPEYQEARTREFEQIAGAHFDPAAWYPVASLLQFMQEIERTRGGRNLFLSGRSIAGITQWGEVRTLDQALEGLVAAFQAHHRNGDVGRWRILERNPAGRAVLASENCYPKQFEFGVLTGVTRKFRPHNALQIDVVDISNHVAGREQDFDFRDAEPKLFEVVWR